MHGVNAVDEGREIDWSKTSTDYATHRPGPPQRFYDCLQALGVGLPNQAILDLGTGTGVLARQFAQQGARVSGIDMAAGQIESARQLAAQEGVDVDFRVSPAEETPFSDHAFDLITANQCWLYFDKEKVTAEVNRLLRPGGKLVTSHFSWLARHDPIAHATEQLVRKHNPAWSAFGWSGEIPSVPDWARESYSSGRFKVTGMFWFDYAVPFTRESWRGRIRACRGVGASLLPELVEAFDTEHDALLREIAPDEFTVLHRIDAHIFELC